MGVEDRGQPLTAAAAQHVSRRRSRSSSRAPLLFAALLVGPGGADAMPAAVLATVTAWILVDRFGDPQPAEAA